MRRGVYHIRRNIFVGALKDYHRVVMGFEGTKTINVKIGKIKWPWLEATRSTHEFIIPNSYVITSGGVSLLIPQHWAQTQGGNNYEARGVGKETTFDRLVRFCNRRKLKLTISLEKGK